MTIARTCATCRHWQPGAQAEVGVCRRNAPIAIAAWAPQANLLKTVWPSTLPNDYCGEHALHGMTGLKSPDSEGLA